MDIKLESLIEKIKKDGVEQAQRTSQEITEKANQDAAAIIDKAKGEAQRLLDEGKKNVAKLRSNAEKSIQQAARDLTLTLKEQLISLFDRLLKRKISQELSPDFLKELIVKIVDKWSSEKKEVMQILVSEKDKKKLEELLFQEFKEEAKNKIDIKISKTIQKGFRIGIKGENVYYDFTDESILEALKEFLSPSLASILNINNG